jgi:palmitoyltransferase ZDHHC9/14/18
MASQDTSTPMQHSPDVDAFPNPQPTHAGPGDTGSILSSQMTDIASDDEGEQVADPTSQSVAHSGSQRRSIQTTTGDGISRPNTGVTRTSSQRGAWSQAPPSRRGYVSGTTAQRGAIPGSMSGSTSGRPQSATSRTHVPSLTSHAFFRPMSSQRLQAQRGGSRPPTMAQQGMSEDGSVEGGSSVARHSVNSNQTARQESGMHEEGDGPPPPSRGTEMTEQETVERLTANTSPTHGHNTTGSLSESVRPLQKNPANTKGLSLNIDKGYKSGGLTTPSKSPRSFRSSFLLPSRSEVVPTSPNRSTQGREKLSSVASSPGLTPVEAPKSMPKQRLGNNYQYFTGNTVFCWGGRLQNTRHRPINIATGLLVLVPGVLFFAFSASWLWHNISPAIPILFAYIYYVCISSFIHASVSDPGVKSSTSYFWLHHANFQRFFPETSTKCLHLTRMMTLFDSPLR